MKIFIKKIYYIIVFLKRIRIVKLIICSFYNDIIYETRPKDCFFSIKMNKVYVSIIYKNLFCCISLSYKRTKNNKKIYSHLISIYREKALYFNIIKTIKNKLT